MGVGVKISVFGLGYVGTVFSGCLAKEGHEVIGVDPNVTKVELINKGFSPIIEKEIPEIIAEVVKNGSFKATTDAFYAVQQAQISLICVGTPSQLNGALDLKFVRSACEEIGTAMKNLDHHIVVVRSTMLPGTMNDLVIPVLEEFSGKKAGVDFGVCNNPEFLREGTAVYDFYHPPKTVIGETDKKSGDILASLYADLPGPMIRTDVATAEMVKYTDNVWHALKIGFANEIGNICKAVDLDGHRVMDIFCQDTKLNLSPYYMKPGFAFGGSCLPKDVRALTYKGRTLDLDLPILNSILPSNIEQIEKGLKMIMDKDNRKIGVLGFSFKAGTDDLRESPMVEVIERLLGKGYDLCIYDENVNIARLIGANKDYILNRIPHISKHMVETMDEVLQVSETIVIGNGSKEFQNVLNKVTDNQVVVDLVRIADESITTAQYDGICW